MKFFKKTDLLIIAVLLAVSLITFMASRVFSEQASPLAEFYYYGELVQTVDLGQGKEQRFSLPQNPHVVFHLYKDGDISFEESDCPDKVCINAGILRQPGQFAACLPNGIVLKIRSGSEKDKEADIIVGL